MNVFKKAILFLLMILFLILPKLNGTTRIIDNSSTTGTLQAKWSKALATGLKQNKSFWLAYSVDRLMAENHYFISSAKLSGCIGTSSFKSTFATLDGIPLGKLLYGKNIEIVKSNPKSGKKQVKEVAVLFLFKPSNGMQKKQAFPPGSSDEANGGSSGGVGAAHLLFKPGSGNVPVKIRQSNMCFPFESYGNPIYWLGKTDENNSLQFLKGLFATINNDKTKRLLLSSIGYHSNSRQVIPFLAKVVAGNETDTVRGKAAGELGDQDNPSAIAILLNVAKKDHSLEVRRKAVNALEDLEFPASVDALIDIAKTANNTYIRKKALDCLSDIKDPRAFKAITAIANGK